MPGVRKALIIENTPEEIRRLLHENGGKIFAIDFTKRTNGEFRTLVGRFGVAKDLKGEGPNYNPADYDLIRLWDVENEGYRCVPLDAVHEIRMLGELVIPEGN
jgi:hypothetical protein